MAVRIEREAEPIPGYKLLERLGGGGFGEVWKVTAPGGLLKAIKFVYGDLETTTEEGQRAEQELKALSRVKTVRHPYILSLERFDIIDGQLMIVMELADRNLWDRFRECKAAGLPGIPREELLRYMEESAEALDLMNTLHQLQHLDIKPQNLFLVHNHAKVADFGLVKDLQGVMASVTGGVTPVYAAPETYDGWVSRFCDQYSLAIVYQELLTGQRPFSGTNIRQLILQHLQMPPNLGPLPASDREAMARALAKNPDERFPTCLEFVQALRGGHAGTAGTHEGAVHEPRPRAAANPAKAAEPAAASAEAAAAGLDISSPELEAPAEGESETRLNTRWLRPAEAKPREAEASPPMAPPPRKLEGDGALFPALVIGLGSLGLAVLQRLREQIYEQFGTPEALPQVRLLYVDTDPEAIRLASQDGSAAGLSSQEVLLTKLNRPSYYLRSKQARTHVDSWFNQRMLYRIPRNPATTGLRALGRLAFFDNYPVVARRLQNELTACTRPELLDAAMEQTGLGLRSNQPRVYVVAGLAGGTGGGMFLDMAYVVRRLFKQRGYEHPEIIGLFLLPAVDRQPGRTLALGNSFAALTELNHFSSARTVFAAQYEEKDRLFQDPGAPYSRCMLLTLPQAAEEGEGHWIITNSRTSSLAGDFLFRDLASPLGRVADEERGGHGETHKRGADDRPGQPVTFETFGLYRIVWPRQALKRCSARRLCARMVQRWMTKDATPVRPAAKAAVEELWAREELGSEHLMAQLGKACEDALEQTVEEAFAAALEPLDGLETQQLDHLPQLFQGCLQQIEKVVGRPDLSAGTQVSAVAEPLTQTAEALIKALGDRLAGFVAQLIEQPEFRLAGAEEAVRQLVATLERELQHYEPLARELWERATEARARFGSLLANLPAAAPANKRQAPAVANLAELLRAYPRWRYQSLVLQRVVTICVSLRGRLSDQLREVNFCRARLGELFRAFESTAHELPTESNVGSSRNIYPAGCNTLEETVKQWLHTLSAEELRGLEDRMQQLVQFQFQGLVYVCLTSTNVLDNLESAMLRAAEQFVDSKLTGVNIADMYLGQQASDEQALDELANAFEQAAPWAATRHASKRPEVCILGTPPGPAGERIRQQVREARPGVDCVLSETREDIVFYREAPCLSLAELEQLGPLAFEAYRQMSSLESFTPHSRTDIQEWRCVGVKGLTTITP
jgi:hypothetical protein